MTIKTLLIDDDRSLLEQADIFLERITKEIEVQTVSSADKALEVIDEKNFDIIVSDYQMPNKDGLEFLEELREERESEIPFIMFTGKGREEVAMKALNLGANRYIQKGGDPKSQYGLLSKAIVKEVDHHRSEKKYKTVVENTNEVLYIFKDGEFLFVNDKAAEVTGYSKEELTDMNIWSLLHPDDREKVKRLEENRESDTKGPLEYETKIVTKGGDTKYLQVAVSPIDYNGQKALLGSATDVTERKRKGRKLKKNKSWLDQIIESSSVPLFVIDEDHQVTHWNKSLENLTDIDKEGVVGTEDPWIAFYEEERPVLADLVLNDASEEEIGRWYGDRFKRSSVLENAYEAEYYYPQMGDDGRWLFFTAAPLKDSEGKRIGAIETLQDITERKNVKGNFNKSEKKFSNIFENLGDPVIVKKLRGKDEGDILDANMAMSDLLGYSSDELVGMNVYEDIIIGGLEELSWEEVKERLKEGNRTEFTVKKKRKDGSGIWVEVVAVPMEYEGEDAVLAVNRDVTERKERENKIRERVKELDCLYTISNLTQKQDMTVERLLQEVVENIPPGFSYPEDTYARITFDGRFYETERFEEGTQNLSQDFSTEYGQGKLEVYVDRERDIFLKREKELLESITIHLENFIERKESQQELERIEWMLSKKEVASTAGKDSASYQDQGYGDLTDLNDDGIILQSLGEDILKDITSEYLDLLETSSAIYEKNGDYAFGIFSSGWCKFMDRQSRKLCDTEDNAEALNSGEWLCHESCWTDCSKKAIAIEEPVDIECDGGIRLYAVPIYAGGEVIGAIDFGYGTPPKDSEKLQELAEKYDVDYEDLVYKANKYNPRPDFIVEMAKNRLHASARLIGTLVERKQAEEQLNKSKKKIKELYDASSIISGIGDFEELYDEVIDIANKILDFDACTIFIEEKGKLIVKASTETELVDDFEMPLDQGVAGKTYRNNKSYLTRDITEETDADPTDSELRSGVSVPIANLGVFQAESYEVGYYDQEDLEIAELLVSHIEEAVQRMKIEEREEFLHSLLRHDVSNKNQVIQGYLELMENQDVPEEFEELVDKAQCAVKDNADMIEKIRKLREIEQEEEIGEIDVSSKIHEGLLSHRDQMREKGINLNVDVNDCKVKGGSLLEEMFSNLVENSIQHSGCDKIKIHSQVDEDKCIVTVEDDGKGITDEMKKQIFDKGFKSGKNAGTGLGLYMVKKIAESYGGSVEVRVSDLGGTRFEIRLKKFDT